jgi:hypothetical protein
LFLKVSILIIKNEKMKKTNLLTVATLCLALGFTSCSKDEGSVPAELCADCHIALPDKSETVWEILDSSGEHIEFCGQELTDIESSSAVRVVTDILISDGGDTLFPGEYGPGSANSLYEIHCGEEDEDH